MYIMCVIPCLLSALSCRVGALQISIIIIIIHFPLVTGRCPKMSWSWCSLQVFASLVLCEILLACWMRNRNGDVVLSQLRPRCVGSVLRHLIPLCMLQVNEACIFSLSVFRKTRRCGATAQRRPLSTAGCSSTVATCWPFKTSRWRRCWPSSPWVSTSTCRTCETLTSLMPRWEWQVEMSLVVYVRIWVSF